MNKQIEEIKELLEEKGIKTSKAVKVRSLLQKQKGLVKAKQSLTDFQEPVLDLHTRDGKIITYEKATAGRFVFEHSSGTTRYIDLRPEDQEVRDYAGRKVRWYTAHEDRPFAGFENPIVDSESYMLSMQKVKATDLKYEQSLAKIKVQSKMAWVYILVGIAVAFMIGAFAYNTWIVPSQIQKAQAIAPVAIPSASMALMRIKSKVFKH